MSGKQFKRSRRTAVRRGATQSQTVVPRRGLLRHRAPVRTREQRPRWWIWTGGAIAVVAIAVIALVVVFQSRAAPSGANAPTGSLAGVDSSATGATVAGISCGSHEESVFHIHAHLAVYVDGQSRGVPEGIGITPPRQEQRTNTGPYVSGGTCIYWVHTHTADGVIHIEAPTQRGFTLGDFFDVWGQPLSAGQVGPARGQVIAYVDGQRYSGDPRAIPLAAHGLVQLDIGQDVGPQPFTFPDGL